MGRWLRGTGRVVVGPWPIYPSAMGWIAVYGLFVSAGARTQVGHKSVSSYLHAVLPQWVGVILTCLVIYALLRILTAGARRVRPVEESRLAYLVVLGGSSLFITGFLVSATSLTADAKLNATLPPIEVRYIISLPVVALVLFIGNGAIASVRARLARQETLLAGRLDIVRSERSLLLAAEEQVRAEASRTLHDDIQAALLRSVVRLEGLRDRLGDDDRQIFDASIDEIEAVREVRVRSLGRVLSPNIADIGLLQALEELGAFYADVMDVDFAFPDAITERFHPVGEPDETALALYRVAEQLLLNALKHGRATDVDVSLEELDDGRVRMIVESDGASPPEDSMAGTGTATINSWLDAAGGWWALEPGIGGGSRAVVVVGRS